MEQLSRLKSSIFTKNI